jgi:transcriptional regulator with XRE-family HTH domain
MTQHDVARAVGMRQPGIARIESGAVLPRTATLMAILEATGHELRVEPVAEVRPELLAAARQRLARSVPRRVRDAWGRKPPSAGLRALKGASIPFVLVGELAEVARGAPWAAIGQVEICHQTDPATLERLTRVLSRTDAANLRPLTETAVGDDYHRLARNASSLIIDTDLVVPVAALADLMRARRARGEDAEIEVLAAVERELSRRDAGSGRRAAAG